jgi:hypothetical protein
MSSNRDFVGMLTWGSTVPKAMWDWYEDWTDDFETFLTDELAINMSEAARFETTNAERHRVTVFSGFRSFMARQHRRYETIISWIWEIEGKPAAAVHGFVDPYNTIHVIAWLSSDYLKTAAANELVMNWFMSRVPPNVEGASLSFNGARGIAVRSPDAPAQRVSMGDHTVAPLPSLGTGTYLSEFALFKRGLAQNLAVFTGRRIPAHDKAMWIFEEPTGPAAVPYEPDDCERLLGMNYAPLRSRLGRPRKVRSAAMDSRSRLDILSLKAPFCNWVDGCGRLTC